MKAKSALPETALDNISSHELGRSYYCFCLEQALTSIQQARALVLGDKTDDNHELPKIEKLIEEALEAS